VVVGRARRATGCVISLEEELNMNVFVALRAAFPADLDAPAVQTEEGLVYSWCDLERATAMVANLFDALDLPPDSRVAVQVEKSVEAMVVYLATLRAGLVYLPLNTAYQSAELDYFIDNAAPAVVVCASARFGAISKQAFTRGVQYVFTLNDDRTGSLLERAAQHSDVHQPAARAPADLAAILYTSGTTGRSKGAMLSHGNLLSNARVLKDYWGWQPGDVLIHALPIFHVHGLFVAIHGALLNGSMVLWMNRFEPRRAIALMAQATVFMGVPTLYTRMLAEPTLDRQATASMRLFVAGSAPLLLETFTQWQERTGHTILERYGMSETLMLTSNPYHPNGVGQPTARRGGTVGLPLPGLRLRVSGPDGSALPTGEVGGIEVSGPSVFAGYWRMPEKTAEEFTADGFFKTGDVGLVDAQGFVSIVGRSKDLYISGGYNVYPAEIEGFMNALPGVAETAIVGVPDADFGEVGVAVVIAKPGVQLQAADLLTQLKGLVARFKVPKRCYVVDELPRNAMGKVQKNLLRARYMPPADATP